MAKAKDVELQNFFVFNPTLGRKEGEEHKKLLYFYPSYEALDAKIKVIGLSEAIISFMETFTDFPCESLHTQKTKQFYFKPEQDFWIVMTVNIPSMEKQVDGRIKLEYCEDHVIDKIYQTVLERSYKMFKMFNGSISHILNKGNIDDLKERFEHFFNKYLSTLRIDHPDILDVFNGMHYLPLERILYLKVQSFVNRLEANIPEIKHTIMLYNYQLIRSGINLDDLRIMYSFLLMGLYPAMMEQDFHVSSFSDKVQSPLLLSPGKFVLGPPSIYDTSDPGQIPRVHIGKDLETYQLLAYRLYDVVVILLIEEGVTPSFDLFRKLDDHFRHHLECLAVELAENKVKRMQIPLSEAGVKFIYFNKTNAAQKSSMHTLDGVVLNVHPDVMRIVSHLNLELNSSGTSSDEDCETVVKMANDCWVVGKKAEDREIYVVVNQKNANLIEINEEVKKLCSTHFCNIFFFD